MINSFLILFLTIKVEIALILKCVSINTHSVMTEKRKKILYTSLILSHHHSHIHTSSFISLNKKHIEGGRKSKKIIFSTLPLSFSLPPTHLFYYLSWTKIDKEKRKKREGSYNIQNERVRLIQEELKSLEGVSLSLSFFIYSFLFSYIIF